MTCFQLEYRGRCEVRRGMCERKIPRGQEGFRVQRGSTTRVRFAADLDPSLVSEMVVLPLGNRS